MKIGAQLYTIREFCKNLDDFSESLKKIADIGYTTVQVSGTCDFDPQWLKNQLDANGLSCVLTHTPGDRMIADAVKVAQDHSVFGCDHIGLGWFSFDESDPNKSYNHFVETYRPVARAFRDNGKLFMYHNHAHEFAKQEGKLILQKISEDFAPDELGFTIDTYWVQVGGGDPAQWIERFSGRVPCIHLKDCAFEQKMAVIGEGNINFDRVFEKAESAGTKYMLVEQDDCYGEDPFDCLKRSYNNLKALGFK
ncbi:MAG: sugar phosphate isomerase/epimerase [Clostridia bacterium]|nr:sugar phosphate isomerase/epimerase [Clostridia bacterium]